MMSMPYPPPGVVPPAPKKKTTPVLFVGATLVAGALIWLSYTAGSAASQPATAASEPQPTVTATVTRSEVPQACLDALDEADKMASIAANSMMTVAEIFEAIQNYDLDAMTEGAEKIGEYTDQIEALEYPEFRDECRASA